LKAHLEHREREITVKSLIMLEKRSPLKYIHHKLIKMKTGKARNDHRIDACIQMIEDYFEHNDWKNEFEKWFSAVHNKFYKNLTRHSLDLTPQETKICAFIKIGMRNKEISRLLHIDEPTVEAHRIHIRKKLQIDRKTNLSVYLSNL
ncbi:helix-turn-helix transcriptional regulator, partial [candidate division KSB1 bacterium]|nr:helix-turn-helix transcriptional regulator [candidate division KSB1 bacterium]